MPKDIKIRLSIICKSAIICVENSQDKGDNYVRNTSSANNTTKSYTYGIKKAEDA